MKADCEACHVGLDPQAAAFICSFECTFCPDCTEKMDFTCPNCGGELVHRPKRKPK